MHEKYSIVFLLHLKSLTALSLSISFPYCMCLLLVNLFVYSM